MHSFKEIRELQKSRKARGEQGLFLAEGLRIVREAPPEQILELYTTEAFLSEHRVLIDRAAGNGAEISVVSTSRMESISDVKTPQGVLGIFRRMNSAAEDLLDAVLQKTSRPLLLILENLQDPGNLGTIVRTAEAAGADGIFLTADGVDLWHPKTIRGTMGSVFRIPCAEVPDTDTLTGTLLPAMRKGGIISYAACMEGEQTLWEADFRSGSALLIGNEGNGLSNALLDAADCTMRIPMKGAIESLNAAMAAGLLLYEAERQRQMI